MDLAAVIAFLVVYYLRPQEWFSLFSTVHFAQLIMLVAIGSLFTREPKLENRDLLRTPHDWAMLLFFLWVVISSGTPWDTFRAIYPFPLFYIAVVQILYNVERMKKFMGWWTFLIVGVAALAISSEFGFDPLGSYDITHGPMKNRLMLNLSIFNNPNGLGHSVVPSIAMLYFFCIWKRPLVMKLVGFGLVAIPLWCIFLTVSKGSFLCCAAVLVLTAIFGRPKTVQIIVLAVVFMLGSAVLYRLPRMTELNKAKGDLAIQGRVAAFTHGLRMLRTTNTGVGYNNWYTSFFHANHYYKAAHSSYVQIGAELGYPGFFLFMGILYCNLRTLLTVRTQTDDEERVRRTLFVLVSSYIISSWMVDFGFRPTFFIFTGAVAALHRHLYGLSKVPRPPTAQELEATALPAWKLRLLQRTAAGETDLTPAGAPLALAHAATDPSTLAPAPAAQPALSALRPLGLPVAAWQTAAIAQAAGLPRVQATGNAASTAIPELKWLRLTWWDFLIMAAMTSGAVRFWAYMIQRM